MEFRISNVRCTDVYILLEHLKFYIQFNVCFIFMYCIMLVFIYVIVCFLCEGSSLQKQASELKELHSKIHHMAGS